MSIFGTIATVDFSAFGAGTTIAAPAINTALGDLIVVAVRASGTAVSIADTAGNVYIPLNLQASGSNTIRLFYCLGALPNASNIITATYSASATFKFIYVWDVPINGVAVFDTQGGAATLGTVTNLTTSNFSTTGIDEIVFAAVSPNVLSQTCSISQLGYILDSSSAGASGFGGMAHALFTSPQIGHNVTMSWTPGSGTAEIAAVAFKSPSNPAQVSPSIGDEYILGRGDF